jgi:hypothetical protein
MPNFSLPFLIASAVAAPLSAQTDVKSAPYATPIRVTTRGLDARALIGIPIRLDEDTIRLVLRGTGDTLTVASASLSQVEELRGRRSNWDRGALAGALALGVAGAIAAPLIVDAIDDGPGSADAEAIGVGFAGGALAGGIIGAGIGALSTRERWSARPHVGIRRVGARDRKHVGISLAITF